MKELHAPCLLSSLFPKGDRLALTLIFISSLWKSGTGGKNVTSMSLRVAIRGWMWKTGQTTGGPSSTHGLGALAYSGCVLFVTVTTLIYFF